MRRLLIGSMLGVLLLTSCTSYNDKRGLRDAPIGKKQRGPVDVIEMPNGVGNVFTVCDSFQPGKRLYMATHSKTDVQPLIVDDPACGTPKPR
jgi:hypothetical protein